MSTVLMLVFFCLALTCDFYSADRLA